MAWRPNQYLIEGELDNTVLGQVTGWMRFAGLSAQVTFALKGDFHRDIRGAKLRLKPAPSEWDETKAQRYMACFATLQTGAAGDMTAGLPPQDYVDYPYLEWYSEANGRVVIELAPHEVEVIGQPIPADQAEPVDPETQSKLFLEFLFGMAEALGSTDTSRQQAPAEEEGEEEVTCAFCNAPIRSCDEQSTYCGSMHAACVPLHAGECAVCARDWPPKQK